MNKTYDLTKFLDAQNEDYGRALSEIKNGKKRSHWMWYIFPQIRGLGLSSTSRFYAINDLDEASTFLKDSILGPRLVEISNELLKLDSNNATSVFGTPDDMKLKSSMTLFSSVRDAGPVFGQVLKKFFAGKKDDATLRILSEESNASGK